MELAIAVRLYLALALCGPVLSAGNRCPYQDGFKKFRCDNGECTPASWVCNGVVDGCKDGSDEKASKCDSVPSTKLSVGQRVTVRVHYKEEFGPVEFHLCDGGQCSRLWVPGAVPGGQLTFSALTRCNARGRYCTGGNYNSGARPAEHFRSGYLVFEAERRAGQLAVWLQGHPDKVATLPAPSASSDTLNVRPDHWNNDMPAAFINDTCDYEDGFKKYRCNSGECTPASWVCNGDVDGCSDGSDEIAAMCDKDCLSENLAFRYENCDLIVSELEFRPAQSEN
ncbi:low-density lipoprotein receptor-like [Thrips palmi]|uniref:Low-density lipoprotein receptor-like n=1 Tax=Thrips palmi TaxID=161013 RepID=A0A6P8Y075_THRPL|nr:low-density lipoprotein receptor-like [Thrips palmi]